MSDLIYSYGKVAAAVQRLATHPGEIKARLMAASGDLVGATVNAMSTPETKTYMARIERALYGTGSVEQAVAAMSVDQARAVAQDLVSLEAMLDDLVADAAAG